MSAEIDSLTNCAECEKPSTLKCSACKLVAYCTKEHQKRNWKVHRNVCRPFEICTSPDIGRHLVTKRDLAKDDVILIEYPVAFGPKLHWTNEKAVPCPGCCRLVNPDLAVRCDGCFWPICEPKCPGLKENFKHGLECVLLGLKKGLATNQLFNYYRQDALFPLRCLILQKKKPKRFQELLTLESHLNKRAEGTEIYETLQKRVVNYIRENFVAPLKKIEEDNDAVIFKDVSEKILHQICGIIDVNALEINQNDAELSALYFTACLMEHNCLPTTYHVFDSSDNFKITVKAAMPIKKGEHLSTTYTNILWGTQIRREHLKLTKYFDCACKRCQDPTEFGSYFSALKCLGTEELGACGGVQLPINPLDEETDWACKKCPVRLAGNRVSELVNQIGDEVENIQQTSPTVKDLNASLKKMSTFLHPKHFHAFAVKHSLIQLYGHKEGCLPPQMHDDLYKVKTEMCRELAETISKIDPSNTRLRLYSGVILHELALANYYFAERKWTNVIGDDVQVLYKLCVEGMEALGKAKRTLEDERNVSSTASKLYDLICKSSIDLEKVLVALE